jgi:hypothetical protein
MEGKFVCKYCDKEYSTSQSRSNHYTKIHKIISTYNSQQKLKKKEVKTIENNTEILINKGKYDCIICNKSFSNRHSKWKHQKKCKNKSVLEDKITKLEKDFDIFKEVIKNKEQSKKNIIVDHSNINTHLINLIVDKSKTIEELKNKIELGEKEDNIILYKKENNYINADKICKSENKNFEDWYNLELTKELIKSIESKYNLVEIIDGERWIHPDLAIQLAYWISPTFALKVTEFIRKLFSKENEIQLQNEKIQLLQNSYLKKQKRTIYERKNYIYMLTTEDNKKKGIYIIGKTTNLTKRLSGYNKSAEHEVVYARECKDEDDLNTCEIMVLNRLKKYREQSNRDRFILPKEKDIKHFKKIIDSCAEFLISSENIDNCDEIIVENNLVKIEDFSNMIFQNLEDFYEIAKEGLTESESNQINELLINYKTDVNFKNLKKKEILDTIIINLQNEKK